MFAARLNPWSEMRSEMNRLHGEMNRLFGRPGFSNGRSLAPGGYPAMNIWEDEDNLMVEAELPGMNLDDLEIFVNGSNQLTLKGERKPPVGEQGTWHRRERGYGKFTRLIELPGHVDAEQVTANFKHGILTIRLPKQEASKPRKIQVMAE